MGQREGDRGSGGRQGGCTGWADVSRAGPRPEARDRDRPGDGEKHGSRDGASRSDADSGSVPGEKGEGRRRENQPGAAGLVEAGMGPSVADADARQPRVEGRRRERLRHRDRETERGSVPALLQVQPGAADLDLNRRQPGDATDTATPLVWNRGWGSGPRSVPTRQRTGGAVASFCHRVAPEIGARP